MWWNGRFTSWMCSRQICSNCVMLSCQYGPNSLRNVSNTLLNLCHGELRRFWRQKGVQPGTRKVCLIKWPVSVYIYISKWQENYSLRSIFTVGLWCLERLNMIGILILTHSHCKWDSNFLNVLIQTKQQMWLSFLHHQWHATLFNLKYLTYLTMYILFTYLICLIWICASNDVQ